MIKLNNRDLFSALIAIACGGYALLVASGLLNAEPSNGTPFWVIGLVGLSFVIAGLMILLRHYSRAVDLLAAVLLGAFTLVAGWVTFDSSPDGMSGGIPFLPRDMNVTLGRTMFGLGTLMCFGGFLYALKRFFGSHK